MSCQARQYSDQMQCGRCGLAWDINDPDPPVCVSVAQRELKKLKELFENDDAKRKPKKRGD